MARHFGRLVGLVCWCVCLNACNFGDNLPKTLWLDQAWNDQEALVIVQEVEVWNAMCREYVGFDCIEIARGRHADPDGFDLEDLSDGRHVIYRVSEMDDPYRYLSEDESCPAKPRCISGWSTEEDTLIFVFMWGRWGCAECMRGTVLHELGHFLSLMHVNFDPTALMYSGHQESEVLWLTANDIRAFCLVHDCLKDPP